MQFGGIGYFAWRLALASVVMSCGLFIWSMGLFLVGLSLTPWHFLFMPLLSLFLLKLTTFRDGDPLTWPGLLFYYVFFIVSLSLLGYVAGTHWVWALADRSLQTELVVSLSNGWNPFYDGGGQLSEAALGSAKAAAVFQSIFYLFAGRFEMSQVHNLWFVLLQFLMAPMFFRALRPYGAPFGGIGTALLLCLNPVLIAQVWTGCVDALLACCLIMLLMIGAVYCLDEKRTNRGWLATGFLFLMFFTINVSTWGIFAVVALMVPLVVWQLFSKHKKQGAVSALVILIGFVVGLAFFGFDPYMKNIIEHGQMLYPLSLQTLQAEMPHWLQGLNPVQQFFYALMANPASDYQNATLASILQFLSLADPQAYLHADPRLRGFGILSPLIFLGILLLLLASFLPPKEKHAGVSVYRLLVIQLLLMTVATPGNWWARLIGFFWLLVVLVINHAGWQGFFQRTAAFLLVLLVLVNAGHYAAQAWPTQLRYADEVEAYVERLTSGELPTDADAQRANMDMASSPVWMELKRKGEGDIPAKAFLPKVEGIGDSLINGRNLWEMQKQMVQNLDGK